MISEAEKGKRLRTRAPLSCLNCKRRKVKCDKGRPCAGCVRNNVGHLCVYVDPKWVEPSQVAASGPLGQNLSQNPDISSLPAHPVMGSPIQSDIVKTSAEYVEIKQKVEAQAKEIMCLRARLKMSETSQAMQTQPDMKDIPSKRSKIAHIESLEKASDRVPLTVLAKLSGSGNSGTRNGGKHAVLYDNLYTMAELRTCIPEQKSATTPSVTSLYSWLNIIKIDPQLTALWFRITNLQKSYHIYKTSLLKSRSRPGLSQAPEMVHSQSTMSNDSSCGHHKCPVVACEFNLMLEESEGADAEAETEKGKEREGEKEKTEYSAKSENSLISPKSSRIGSLSGSRGDDALGLLTRLQDLWREILGAGRNTETLDFQQLLFLVKFYTEDSGTEFHPSNSKDYRAAPANSEVESRELLSFFKQEILGLFSQNGNNNEVRLEIELYSSKMSDAEVINSLKTKAIYIAMLAIIVEESIEHLHSRPGNSEFRIHFPLEKIHAGTSHKPSTILAHTADLMQDIFDPQGPVHEIDNSMAAVSLMVAYLNRIGLLYERRDILVDVRDSFTNVFTLLLQTLIKNGTVLQIWCDPAQVVLKGNGASVGQRDKIRVVLCRLWTDFLRLANNATFHILPYLRHSAHIDKLLEILLEKVPRVESANTHVTYLKKLQSSESSELVKNSSVYVESLLLSLQMQHLIARTSITLRNGISGNFWEGGVAVCDLLGIANEMTHWTESQELDKLSDIRSFEVKVIFHYLSYFLTTIVFLQHEDGSDQEAISRLVPVLFQKVLALNKFLQSSSVQYTKDVNGSYVWSVVAENLARVSHLVSGLLIRFKSDAKSRSGSKSPETGGASQTPELLVYASRCGDVKIPVSNKEEVIREADKTVSILQSAMGKEASRNRTKIWKFYQTFIRNSHKQNPVSYANIHADVFGSGKLLNSCPIMANNGYEVSATRMELSKCPVFHAEPSNVSEKVSNTRSVIPSRCPVAGISAISNISDISGSFSRLGNPAITDSIAGNVKMDGSSVSSSVENGNTMTTERRASTPQPPAGKCPFGHDTISAASSRSDTPLSSNFDNDVRKRKWEYSQSTAASREPRGENQTLLFGRLTKFTPPLCVPTASPIMPQPTVSQPAPMPDTFTNTQEPFGDMDWDSLPNFNFDLMEDEALMGQLNGGDFNNSTIEGLFQ